MTISFRQANSGSDNARKVIPVGCEGRAPKTQRRVLQSQRNFFFFASENSGRSNAYLGPNNFVHQLALNHRTGLQIFEPILIK